MDMETFYAKENIILTFSSTLPNIKEIPKKLSGLCLSQSTKISYLSIRIGIPERFFI